MTLLLDERIDGSLAVYIDGDLQFDSRDEGIYHEALALPALALAAQRKGAAAELRVLICGGGDGLVAREILKVAQVARIDLVDYDPTILCLARDEWGPFNAHSLHDLRTFVHVRDAWEFVAEAASAGRTYDVIICDFTVPRDLAGARLHTIEWYEQLRGVLAPQGVMAVNATSPAHSPPAYWSIYNSLRTATLNPRPYRIVQPSFAAHGYGDDWGFFLAGRQPIQPTELATLPLATPRTFLRDVEQLKRCFTFPLALVEERSSARPTRPGSEWLLHALFNPVWKDAAGQDWDALSWEIDPAPLPAPDAGGMLLPHALHPALHQQPGKPIDETALLNTMLDLMPALRPNQTRSMIREFIAQPGRFLAAIDLRSLVDALLRRATALPRRLVAELRLLRAHLGRTWRSSEQLLQLGLRIVSIIALVIMLSNLLYPDTVYGKGGVEGGGAPSAGRSFRSTGAYDVVAAPPSYVSGRGYRSSTYRRGYAVDELGSFYPTRRYRYYGGYYGGSSWRSYNRGTRPPDDPNQGDALYRLTPETDVLANGEVVIALTDKAYLLLADEVTSLIDADTGLPVMFLKRDPALVWRTHQELTRQRAGLGNSVEGKKAWIDWMNWIGFAHWNVDDQDELTNMTAARDLLDKAIKSLGSVPAAPPTPPTGPDATSLQLFTSVWTDKAGSQLVIDQADGSRAYLNREGWWSDEAHTQTIDDPYPEDLRKIIVGFLKKEVADQAGITTRLTTARASARNDLTSLQADKTEYEQIQRTYGPSDTVDYGTAEMAVSQALKLTNDDLVRTQQLIDVFQKQINEAPAQALAEKELLKVLDK